MKEKELASLRVKLVSYLGEPVDETLLKQFLYRVATELNLDHIIQLSYHDAARFAEKLRRKSLNSYHQDLVDLTTDEPLNHSGRLPLRALEWHRETGELHRQLGEDRENDETDETLKYWGY